jgi:hypothetical protein
MQSLESGLETERRTTSETQTSWKESPGERLSEVRRLPYRMVLADWPDEWRERWGRRANALEESGLSWRDAEGRAFVEVWSQLRASGYVERN